jgi:GTP-binding protein
MGFRISIQDFLNDLAPVLFVASELSAVKKIPVPMKIKTASHFTSSPNLELCPDSTLPEFAFVGRSNVGKSSLINMLTGREGLARTSSQPGKTQLINFFKINNIWCLVDLPGYGYAKVSKRERQEFNENISEYLIERESLKHVFALIDSQHEPMDSDLTFIEWLQEMEIPFSLIFTKTDRASDSKVKIHTEFFLAECETLAIHPVKSFSCSSKTQAGRKHVLQFIEALLPRPQQKTKSGKQEKKQQPSINLGWMKKGK